RPWMVCSGAVCRARGWAPNRRHRIPGAARPIMAPRGRTTRERRSMHERLRAYQAVIAVAIALCLPAPALAAGTPAAAWDQSGEGARLSRDGSLEEALAAFTAARTSIAASRPLDRGLADALALDLYNLGAAFTSAKDATSALDCFRQIFLLRTTAGSLRD